MSLTEANKTLRNHNRLCALLMAVMLICQFTPFWHYGEGSAESASISGYVWFPENYKTLTTELKTLDADHRVNNVVIVTVPMLLLCAIGTVMCLFMSDSLLTMLFPAAAGILGLIGYPCTAALRAGTWGLHAVICLLMLAAGALGLVRCGRAAQGKGT